MTHDLLREVGSTGGYELSDDQLERLERYLELLQRDRDRLDLTAIRNPGELVRRQVGESLALLRVVEEFGLPAGSRLTDIGSGGGAPGIPIAIARPDLDPVLIEASTIKAAWLSETVEELDLRAAVLAIRAEEAGRQPDQRAQSDAVVAKAVAPLRALLELSIPLLRTGACLFAPKGSRLDDELEQAADALDVLAAAVVDRRPLSPFDRGPVVLIVRKLAATAERFPRSPAAIGKRPL